MIAHMKYVYVNSIHLGSNSSENVYSLRYYLGSILFKTNGNNSVYIYAHSFNSKQAINLRVF